jgi:hypothetical protein
VTTRRLLASALPLAIFVVTLAAFVPTLDGQFLNWDDDRNFLRNPNFRGLGWAQLTWMWSSALLGHYIPLTWMTLGLNYLLGGMNPWGYHLGNMLIHATNAVLFYFVARRLLRAAGVAPGTPLSWGAAFAALVFGVHPLRAESVAWITERRDVLCGFFFLSSVLAHLRWVETGRHSRRVLSIAAFVAALLSKAQALPLPVALLILDLYPLRRVRALGWRRVLVEKIPYAAASLVGAVVTLVAVKHGSGFTDYHQYGPAARVAMTGYGLLFYPWKWLWPVGLSPLYELPDHLDPLAVRFLVPMCVFAVVTVALVALRRRWPGGLTAWVYSAIMLLPMVGPVHAGHQLAHDRYSYLSGFGFAILAGAALIWALHAGTRGLLGSFSIRACAAAAVLIVVGLAASTWVQAGGWKDSETLWSWAVDVDSRCATCYSNLGEAVGREHPGEAEAAFRRALALSDRPIFRNNLGAVLEMQGRLDEAEREYRRALDADPTLPEARANLDAIRRLRAK